MLEPPALAEETIAAVLEESYSLLLTRLDFLPLGNAASAWSYRAEAGGRRFFLKAHRGLASAASLLAPRVLKDGGVENVVAPLPTLSQDLQAAAGEYSLAVYPFIDGQNGMEAGLSGPQWVEAGRILRQVHACLLTPALRQALKREDFRPRWSPVVTRLAALIERQACIDPAERSLADYWRSHQEEIEIITRLAERLGQTIRRSAPPFVLCHADYHTANLLVDEDGQLWVVDWDDTLIAPKERDLMFAPAGDAHHSGGDAHHSGGDAQNTGGDAGREQSELFFKGYGRLQVDALVLAYYRCEWVVQEIGDFGERVFFPQAGAETQAAALQGFFDLFRPGDVVAGARAALASLADRPEPGCEPDDLGV